MTIFCLALDYLIISMQALHEPLCLSGSIFSVLAYADDLVVIAPFGPSMAENIAHFEKISNQLHLRFKRQNVAIIIAQMIMERLSRSMELTYRRWTRYPLKNI